MCQKYTPSIKLSLQQGTKKIIISAFSMNTTFNTNVLGNMLMRNHLHSTLVTTCGISVNFPRLICCEGSLHYLADNILWYKCSRNSYCHIVVYTKILLLRIFSPCEMLGTFIKNLDALKCRNLFSVVLGRQ